jgi:hypothetical protein
MKKEIEGEKESIYMLIEKIRGKNNKKIIKLKIYLNIINK